MYFPLYGTSINILKDSWAIDNLKIIDVFWFFTLKKFSTEGLLSRKPFKKLIISILDPVVN